MRCFAGLEEKDDVTATEAEGAEFFACRHDYFGALENPSPICSTDDHRASD